MMKTGQGNVSAHKPFISNPPSFASAQSSSITGQMYSPVCAAPVSFPFDTLLLASVPLENDKTGTTAELSVPHTTGRKLPSFHSSCSISSSCSRAAVYAYSFTEIHARPCHFFSAHIYNCAIPSECIRNVEIMRDCGVHFFLSVCKSACLCVIDI